MEKLTALLLVTFSVLACLIFQGCAHHYELTLDKVEKLPLGAPKSEIEAKFGEPTDIIENEWFYALGDYNRAVFKIDQTTGQVFSKFWGVREGETEQNLETTQSRYPNTQFKSRNSKVKAPHGGLDYVWYENSLSEVSILFRKSKNRVDSIVWCKDLPTRPCQKD